MPDWSIKIVPSPSGEGAAFQPDLHEAKPGDPLRVMQDDLVTWNNTTGQTHQPWPASVEWSPFPLDQVQRGGPNYLSDPIPAGESSQPAYDAAQPADTTPPPQRWTVYYVCKLHPNVPSERGTIAGTAY
jgi:plastocyanin